MGDDADADVEPESWWFCPLCSGGQYGDVDDDDQVWHSRTVGIHGPDQRGCPDTLRLVGPPVRTTKDAETANAE